MSLSLTAKLHPIFIDGNGPPRNNQKNGLKGGKQRHVSERKHPRRDPGGVQVEPIIAIVSEPKVITETKILLKSILLDSTPKSTTQSEQLNKPNTTNNASATAAAIPVIPVNKKSGINPLFSVHREMICPKISLIDGLMMGVTDSSPIQMHYSPHPPSNIYHSKLPHSKLSPRRNVATPLKSIAQYPPSSSGDRVYFDINTTTRPVELVVQDTKPVVGMSFSSVNYDLDRVLSVSEAATTVTVSEPRRFDKLIMKPDNFPSGDTHYQPSTHDQGAMSRNLDIPISITAADGGSSVDSAAAAVEKEGHDIIFQDNMAQQQQQPAKTSSYIQFGNSLTEFEMSEQEDFEKVYLTGLPIEQKIQRTSEEDCNHGFDDRYDVYKAIIGDHIGFRYEIIRQLGLGSFGDVYKCKDHKTGEMVAVKIVKRRKRFSDQALNEIEMLKYLARHSAYYSDTTTTAVTVTTATNTSSSSNSIAIGSGSGSSRRSNSTDVAAHVVPTIRGDTSKGGKHLQHKSSSSSSSGSNNHHSDIIKPIIGLSESDSIDDSVTDIGLADSSSITGGGGDSVTIDGSTRELHGSASNSMARLLTHFEFRCHHCLVFPLHGLNLFEYLKKKEFVGLPVGVVKKIATQLLHCLVHLKNLKMIHSDLKPENILLKNELDTQISVVLVDFGSSCLEGKATQEYIQSRFYRSPEVIFGMPYGTEIDMWSFACLLPELRTAVPAFAGESELDQLAAIAEVLGHPPRSIYDRVPLSRRDELFQEDPPSTLLSKSQPQLQDQPLHTTHTSSTTQHDHTQPQAQFPSSENISDSRLSITQEEDNHTTMSELSSGTIEATACVYEYNDPSPPNQSETSLSLSTADSNNNNNNYYINDDYDSIENFEFNTMGKKTDPVELILRLSPLTGRVRAAGSRYIGSLINERAQDASFVSFLSMCLRWEPEVRLTPQQALQHPWLLPGDTKESGVNGKKKKKEH